MTPAPDENAPESPTVVLVAWLDGLKRGDRVTCVQGDGDRIRGKVHRVTLYAIVVKCPLGLQHYSPTTGILKGWGDFANPPHLEAA